MVCMFMRAHDGGVSPTPRMITLGETMALITPAHAEPLRAAHEVPLLDIGGASPTWRAHVAQLGFPPPGSSALGDDALGRAAAARSRAAASTRAWST